LAEKTPENTDDRDRLAEAMAADAVPPPPPDLAGQVVAAMSAQAQAPERPVTARPTGGARVYPLAVALAAGVAIGAVGMVLTERAPSGAVATGDRRPSAKETIQLGSRAVLVAEAGADLRWRPGPEDGVLVEQSAGAVFYRVNTGRFVVETPHGLVRVQGTCFRVEVTDMKLFHRPNLSGAALGAALGAAVVVSVYEGRVLLARGSDEVVLGPGDSGQVTAGGRPERRTPSAGREAAAGGLRPATVPRFQETETLRARIAEQEKELAELRAMSPLAKKVGESKRRYFEPSREELLARVERCEIAFDSPPINGFDEKAGRSLGLAEAEREAMNETMKELKPQVIADMRALYVEMSGDPTTADRLSPGAMETEIFSRAPEGSRGRARRQIAREKAGLAPPPADLSQVPVAERTMRLMMGIGDRYEQKLAERLGPDRARALRAREDGWAGKTVSNGCE
jgi:hypothetical protein